MFALPLAAWSLPTATALVARALSVATVVLSGVLVMAPAGAQQRFSELVGPVKVGPVQDTGAITLPFITWGGDTATFHANGGLKTKPGSLFAKQGLDFQLRPGDDFIAQVRDYMAGKTPFLRGTFRMMGMASEVIGSDPRTKGVMVMQMTWSAGDHMVGRPNIKTLNDLKGKRIALQQGGPHVGMLDDVLALSKISWDEITPVWFTDLSGPKGPAEAFRKDPSLDACFVITPDMIGLTGGLEATGSGAEGTVSSAKVVVSTAELGRSIADVYLCRKDYFDANRAKVRKFVAGYMKACEEVVTLRNAYDKGGSKDYETLLGMTQSIYGADVIPTLEEDAHGLILDCSFVGYPGNVTFFNDKTGTTGFMGLQKSALDLATSRGYAKVRSGFFAADWDYQSKDFTGYLSRLEVTESERFGEATLEALENFDAAELDENTLVSFTVGFKPNQTDFSVEAYGTDFQRVIDSASKASNVVINVRGHADPTQTLGELVRAGLEKGILTRTGSSGAYRYFLDGERLDLGRTERLMELIEQGVFDGSKHDPRLTAQAALNLSRKRAQAVRDAVIKYAKDNNLSIDLSQIQPVGVGIREPVIARPRKKEDALENMRVEFRMVRVPAEVVNESDFDF